VKRFVAAAALITCLLPAREGIAQVTVETFGAVKTILTTVRVTTSVPALGLGGSGSANCDDPSYAALNPAIFGTANHALAYAASIDSPDEADVKNLQMSGAFGFKAGKVKLRAGLAIFYTQRQTSPMRIPLRTPFAGPDTFVVSQRDDSYFGAALAGAIDFDPLNISLGFAPKQVRVRDDLLGLDRDVTVYDMGGVMWVPIQIGRDSKLVPSVGISYLNAGSDNYFEIPGTVRYGARLRYENSRWTQYGEWAGPDTPFFSVSITADAIDPQPQLLDTEYAVGAELAIVELLFVRGGYHDSGDDGEPLVGLGIGPVTDHFMLRIDGAWSEGEAGAFAFMAGVVF